ncbi:MAG: protein kinase, partial [Myxococcales bacterium]|nr:protein kinase [Myxococcales bacterium]
MQANAEKKGAVVGGEYVLQYRIGRADSNVYAAECQRDGQTVAVRLLGELSPEVAERVMADARAAMRVRHPMIASVLACDTEPDGTVFVVSEFVDGTPLSAWADAVGIPPLGTVVDFVHRLCLGLQAVNRAGLTHHAIAPHNILVLPFTFGPEGRVAGKLLDLGIPASTRAGRIDALSAQFMAPEQLLQGYGARSSISGGSACSNVYSVGAVLYYLCTGGVPYPARTVRELVALREAGKALRPARINPSIPAPLNAIMLRSLVTSASERYPSVSELAEALAFSLPNGQPRPEDGPQGRSSRHSAETLDSFDDIPTGQVILPPGGLPDDLSSLEDSQAEHTPVTGSAGMPRASAPAPKGSFSSHPAPPTASVSTPPAAGSLPPPPPAERPPGPSMDAREPSPTRTSGLPPLGHSHSGIAPRPRPEPPGAPGESASRPSRPPSVLRQTQRPVPEPAAHRETAGQTQPPAAGIPPLPPTPSRSAPPPPPPSVPPPVLPPA